MPKEKPYVFIDVETTGGRYTYDRIIEIGAIRVEANEIVATYHSLLHPNTHLSPDITNLTGITQKDLELAPTFNQIKHDLHDLLSDAIFVAHNSSFDYGFIRAEFKRHHIDYSAKHLCTVKLSRKLFPNERHHNLDAVINRCGIICQNRHRALSDAQAIWQFWQYIHQHINHSTINTAIKSLLKIPTLPATISKEMINRLPEAPGVYLFYNQEGAPLYIGKSINLKDRILSHFSASTTSTKERALADSIHTLEIIPTAGDLHAQLLESHLIKSLQPIYNRKLRLSQLLVTLTKTENARGYYELHIDQSSELTSPDVVGVFRSIAQAKNRLGQLASKHSLCPKLIGLEQGKGPCFQYHLNQCSGACINKENPLKYNIRIAEAIAPLKLKRWPFSGPIILQERYDEYETRLTVSDWRITGCEYLGFSNANTIDLTHTRFDLDTYKILSRYVLTHQHSIYILQN